MYKIKKIFFIGVSKNWIIIFIFYNIIPSYMWQLYFDLQFFDNNPPPSLKFSPLEN